MRFFHTGETTDVNSIEYDESSKMLKKKSLKVSLNLNQLLFYLKNSLNIRKN